MKNESAFPIVFPGYADHDAEIMTFGLTKREWLAGQALAGYLAAGDRTNPCSDFVAKRAASYADALLAELAKQGPPLLPPAPAAIE